MKKIETVEELETIYGNVDDRAIWKEIDHINDHYRQFIEASPFLIISTHGEKGIDCSPRGDPPGFVRIVDEKTLLIPDRRGNNRLDTLKNIVVNPSVGLIFLIPNVGETIRVSGTAEILLDVDLCASFVMNDKPATSVLSIHVDKAYFQCQKALARSSLWQPESWCERNQFPSSGDMVKVFAANQNADFDGEAYDRNYPARMKKTIY